MRLPPNIERVRALLFEAQGRMSFDAVGVALAGDGIHIKSELLRSLPTRFPDTFRSVGDQLEIRTRANGDPPNSDAPPAGAHWDSANRRSRQRGSREAGEPSWWTAAPSSTDHEQRPIDLTSTSVIAIVRQRVDAADRHVLVARRFGGGPIVAVDLAAEDAHRLPAVSSIAAGDIDVITPAAFGEWLGTASDILTFASPTIRSWLDSKRVATSGPARWVDIVAWSTVLAPHTPSRDLVGLERAFGLKTPTDDWQQSTQASAAPMSTAQPVDPAGAIMSVLSRVEALAAVLANRWSAPEAIPALAFRLLERSGHPLAAIPHPVVDPGALADELISSDDPLVGGSSGARFRTASAASSAGFQALAEQPAYRYRPSQHEMADLVGEALDRGGRVAIEAPTGTGKSLGYLLPAIGRASSAPVVVTTHTKVLQRQLRSDAERLAALGLLNVPFRQLFGVSNYICLREAAELLSEPPRSESVAYALAVAITSVRTSPTGVWDEVTDRDVAASDREYRQTRRELVASQGTCERSRCDWAAQCPMTKRSVGLAENPGIIAANHALVATWLSAPPEAEDVPEDSQDEEEAASQPIAIQSTRRRGTARLFVDRPTDLIVDEAHTAEEAFTAAWTKEVGAHSLRRLLTWIWSWRGPVESARQVFGASERSNTAAEVQAHYRDDLAGQAVRDLGVAVGHFLHEFGGSGGSVSLLPHLRSSEAFRSLHSAASLAAGQLRGLVKGLTAISISLTLLASPPAYRARRKLESAIAELEDFVEQLDRLCKLDDTHRFVHIISAGVDEFVRSEDRKRSEIAAANWSYEIVPIEIDEQFREQVAAVCHSVTLTSATLRVNDSFDFISRRLGLGIGGDDAIAFEPSVLRSPFDYDNQSAVVLTSHLPIPTPSNERAFVEELASDQAGFLSLSRGRSLTLFAAKKRMNAVADLLQPVRSDLNDRGVEILVQHRDGPSEIRSRFRTEPGVCAFGLKSYWEGFDAPGETLSFLFIEKPPYPHPGDPLTAARKRVLEDRGEDAFADYIVPLTAITLAQGFGRLIRSETDRGVAYLYDRRLQQPRSTNETLLRSLPTNTVHFASSREDAWRYGLEFVDGAAPDLTDALRLISDTTAERLSELRLLPGESPRDKIERTAREVFGIDQLHPEQIEIIEGVLEGRDVLGFLPTGRGKSICYQLPALINEFQRPFVVVSPLVALIKDQVDDLRARRGLRSVVGIAGRTSKAEQTEALRDLVDGHVRLLYISPERLVRDPVLRSALASIELGALIVDEAHCISSWGHDFRPEFRQIAPSVKAFRRSPRVALTATATPDVERDIAATLEMVDPLTLRHATDRPDIAYWAFRCDGERERLRELLRFVAAQDGRPGVVYASRRALTEEVAWALRQTGRSARSYHAGMLPEQREAVQDDFLAGDLEVVVATKAFGMGVNKSDIAWVVHYDPPESLESYAQEAGRAARDPSLTGMALVLWTRGDLVRRKKLLEAGQVQSDASVASRLVEFLRTCPTRRGDALVDPEELAEHLDVEPDKLNVIAAWLEQLGVVERLADCATRSTVTMGRIEPTDRNELELFFRTIKVALGCKIGVQRRLDVADAAELTQMDPDDFEELLTRWSLQRFVTYQTTQRVWRVRLTGRPLDEVAYARIGDQWRTNQLRRLAAMETYLARSQCRRSLIAAAFSDPPIRCADDSERCDHCATETPSWHSVPISAVPDPEDFVDVALVALQAIAWANRTGTRGYARRSMCAALLGNETIGDHPISPGLLRCPQFGALRYVRGSARQLDSALRAATERGLIEEVTIESGERSWVSLRLTDAGRHVVGSNA